MTLLAAGAAAAFLFAPLLLRPAVLGGLAALAMLFSGSLEAITQVDMLGYSDEGLTLAFVVLAILTRKGGIRALPGIKALLLFTLVGAISSAVSSVPLEVAGLSMFILLKPWLFAIGLAQLDWTPETIRRGVRLSAWAMVAMIAGVAANMVLGQAWIDLWNGTSFHSYRFGIASPQGLFPSQLVAGNVMAAATILVLTHAWVFGATVWHRLLIIGGALGAALTGRRTAVLGGLAGGILARMRFRSATTVLQVVLVLPIAAVASWSVLTEAASSAYRDYVVQADTTPRVIMHRDMFDVANQHLPFGAGFGRFGSYMAGAEYSPEYLSRGYQTVWGLSESAGNSTFLSDTQWPAVIGEAGYFGALFALFALASVARAFGRASRAEDQTERWLGLAGIALFVQMLVASVGLPVFFGGCPPQVLLFGLLGVLTGYRATTLAETSEAATASGGRVDRRSSRVYPR